MKIALVAPEFLPNWGGVGTYCVELAKRLAEKKNIEVHVVTLKRNIKGSHIQYSESEILDYFKNKIHLHIVSNARETFLYNAMLQYRIFRDLPKIVKDNKIELVHSQHAHMSDILVKFRNSSCMKIPSVTTVHSTIKTQYQGIKATNQQWLEMDSSEKFELMLHPFLLAAEMFYLKNCSNLIFVSHWTKRHIKENYSFANSDGSVIHNGVDVNQYSPSQSSSSQILSEVTDPIVLYASRLTVARGAHVFARAIPKILKQNRKVHFVFAGSGNNESVINILNAGGVPKEKYTFLGYVDYKDLPSLYAKAYAYVMPTSWENLPFKLLEAMSSGVPVVTTNVGGIPEVVKNGFNGLYTLRTPNDLAEKVNLLLDDRQLASVLGHNSRRTVLENFTWDETVRKTERVYNELLCPTKAC